MSVAANGVTVTVVEDHFPQIIRSLRPKAERIVAKAALDIQANAQTRAPVDTGALRASIQAHRVGPAHWRVTVGVDYGIYQEYGTVHHAAQPFMRPAVAIVRPMFRKAMRGVVGL